MRQTVFILFLLLDTVITINIIAMKATASIALEACFLVGVLVAHSVTITGVSV